jgi:hypothetical protein
MKYIKLQGYTLGKKMCLSNKHLIIFWVISIGHADYYVSNCYTKLIAFFYFLFFYEGFNSWQHIIFIHDRHIGYFWFKTCIPNIPNIVCVQSTICGIITKTKYYFRYLLNKVLIYWKKKCGS